MKLICISFLILFSLPALADEKFVFATHSRAPVSLFLTDVIQEALKPFANQVEVLEMSGSRVIVKVNNGTIDGDLSRIKNFQTVSNIDASNYRLVDEPIVLIEIVLITLAEKEIVRPITWDTINNGSVAYPQGSKTIRKHLKIQNRVSLASSNQVLKVVANKRVDSAVMFASVAEFFLGQSTELSKKLTIHRPPLMSFPLYIYLNKKHSQLIPKLETSLRKLKENGFLENAANKHRVKLPINGVKDNKLIH